MSPGYLIEMTRSQPLIEQELHDDVVGAAQSTIVRTRSNWSTTQATHRRSTYRRARANWAPIREWCWAASVCDESPPRRGHVRPSG